MAEVGYQNKWQRAALAIGLVGSDKRQLEADASQLQTLCQEATNIVITEVNQEWI